MGPYKWSNRSLQIRAGLDKRLKKILDEILQHVDITLVSGHRSKEEQERLFREGYSQLQFPQSKHNSYPSLAVDVQPWPYPEKEEELWAALGLIAGMAIIIGEHYGVEIRWGGDWDRDGSVTDNNFDDLFHLEIVEDG